MKIAGYDIKPISLYLPDDPEWVERDNRAREYFKQEGIEDVYWVAGIHASRWGIQGRHVYLLDNPAEQFYIGDAKVGGFLSMYVVYSVMNALPDSHFMFLETDCNFEYNWKERFEQVMKDIPSDFDFLFGGSCCAEDKEPVPIKGELYHFPNRGEAYRLHWPQCGHFFVVAKKCLPFLIATNRDVANPIDVSLILNSFPQLNVFGVLPRSARQAEQTIIPK